MATQITIGDWIYIGSIRRKIIYVSDNVIEWNYGWCRTDQIVTENNKLRVQW
jgi:hypothetical protein